MTAIRTIQPAPQFGNFTPNITSGGAGVYVQRLRSQNYFWVMQDYTYLTYNSVLSMMDYVTGNTLGARLFTNSFIGGANIPDTVFVMYYATTLLIVVRADNPSSFNNPPTSADFFLGGDSGGVILPWKAMFYPRANEYMLVMEGGLYTWSYTNAPLICNRDCSQFTNAQYCTKAFIAGTCTTCNNNATSNFTPPNCNLLTSE